ncbi:PilN domain-containing protein [Thermodesulfatator autotrophicus]|uniref:Pilus assembly protein PilN n=1 Tax=Thermodesulfatator autotrophicus TaxID=1795632 RepID=A0A177E7Y0_9BACT|nr:PilN domain-containing protein [Thermodesulfatator autotrophicus]OAG27601.1 hypothetical protein TH606_06070 [Thermodesulfatator autotrophicus]
MIRINLNPRKTKKKARDLKFKFLFVLLLISYVIMASSFFYLKKKEDNTSIQVAKINSEIKKYKKIEKEINKIKKETEEIEKRIDVIISLIRDNPLVIRSIDFTIRQLPVGKVALSKLSAQKYNINVSGQGESLKAIASFMKRLEEKNFVKKVYLTGTKRDNKNKLINFNLKIETKDEF